MKTSKVQEMKIARDVDKHISRIQNRLSQQNSMKGLKMEMKELTKLKQETNEVVALVSNFLYQELDDQVDYTSNSNMKYLTSLM